jgi:Zn-dependent alcohol dehydrogenase
MKSPIKFKAAVLVNQNQPLSIQEVYFKGPLDFGQVLVRVMYTGICGKQLDEINGVHGEDKFLPHMLGHEGVGVVEEVGPGVKKVIAGDKVILHWMKGEGIQSLTPKYCNHDGAVINAGWVTTFNEYSVVSENRLTKIQGKIGPELALLGCAIPTAFGLVFNDLRPKPGESVMVIGAGGIGLFVLQALMLSGMRDVSVVDVNQSALQKATVLGLKNVFNMKSINNDELFIKQMSNGGFDRVIVTTGKIEAIEFGVSITKIPGETVLLGVPKFDANISVNANAIMHKRNIVGNLGGSIFPDRDIPAYHRMMSNQLISTEIVINKIYPFHEINTAIERFKSGESGRFIIKI